MESMRRVPPSRPPRRCSEAGDLQALDAATLEAAFADLPRATVAAGEAIPSVLDLLIESGLSASRGQARRVIADGGAYVNNIRVTDEAAVPSGDDLLAGRWLLLRRGKRSLAVVAVELPAASQ